jgi:uncharacterized protein YbgA (DUF1722 family)/uncharacterized protein YbbK (DUF523 family)
MEPGNFSRPLIFLSACLNSEPVRYNREIIHDEFIEKLKNFVDIITVCPEVSIGLGVPREPIKIYLSNDKYGIFQPATQTDYTEKMIEFSLSFMKNLPDIDGFILKGKSPSCGYSGTKIYRDKNAKDILKRGMGLFAQIVKEKYSDKPIEDEFRLKNQQIRYHFLTRIFSFAEMKNLEKNIKSIKQLIDFHTKYKYLLMLYNQKKLSELGKIVAGYKKGKLDLTIKEYSAIFYTAFGKKPGIRKELNVLNHIYGYFSHKINENEKKHFRNLLNKFEEEKIDKTPIVELLKNFALRFGIEYLVIQKYLRPYPEELD